ncbi:glycoside hydrolase family 3 N-terminal domain-containing protein [Amycolatopsis sp. H20-H5]|uniref:glycoside hydrolase family 3 N-terminal domain-containing protein n=1 Tax=Amycolatopsis sp. H20-H5 TaxID=3046309 RepID=UPI002DBC1935|nr:glycoside hydrolase family 3 N-terminal domain-containing protein [Amycolatopsis sp. H20-H5]MEC3982310.1 glycoside hydrolase family 3 N-terminal domain-containing protein [Amycolatopsis sp. H20-H5]
MSRLAPRTPLTRRLLATIALGATAASVLVQCDAGPVAAPPSPPVAPRADSQTSSAPPVTRTDPATACDRVVKGMTVRQQLAQLVVVGVDATDARDAMKVVSGEQVGGIFLGGNKTGLLEGGALDGVQRAARIPVSVAIDEEGGRVQRLDDLDGSIPSARQMAATMSPRQVRDLAEKRGKAMRARGVTVDYAPDADVTEQADDEIVGDRSFSADPEKVRSYALEFAAGLRAAGVMPVLKHFPGHGHGTGDSHKGAVQTPPLDQLRKLDLLPYRDIGEYGETGVMVGHLDVPGLTGGQPASLSAPAYKLLREDYGFTGPALTDDLGAMKAITAEYSLPVAVLKALQAGADEALWSSGGRLDEVLDRLQQAFASGELPAARVRDALERVLTSKQACK